MTREEKINALEKKIAHLKNYIVTQHPIVQQGLQMWIDELEEGLEIIRNGGQDPFS